MNRTTGLAVIALASFLAPPLWAAEVSRATLGSRVRVSASSRSPIVGSLVGVEADRLLIAAADGAEPLAVPRASIQKFEMSHGPKSKAKGALVGGLIGAGLGAAWGVAASQKQSCDGLSLGEAFGCAAANDLADDTAANIAIGVGVLGGLGAIVGAVVTHGERWHAASVDGAAVAVVPVRRGAALRVSIGF